VQNTAKSMSNSLLSSNKSQTTYNFVKKYNIHEIYLVEFIPLSLPLSLSLSVITLYYFNIFCWRDEARGELEIRSEERGREKEKERERVCVCVCESM